MHLLFNDISFITLHSEHSPGSSSSSSDWSISPLTGIDQKDKQQEGPDRLMGPPVVPRLPSILKNQASSRFR